MAITRINNGTFTIVGPVSSSAIGLGSTPTDSNSLILIASIKLASGTAQITSITQTGAVWTNAVRKSDATTGLATEIWYASNVRGASTTVTINYNTTILGSGIIVSEYSGLALDSALDKTAVNIGTSTNPDTGTTATTSSPNELWIGSVTQLGSPGTFTTPTNSFSLVSTVVSNSSTVELGYLEKIVSTTGTADSGVTSNVPTTWLGAMATFLAATGPLFSPFPDILSIPALTTNLIQSLAFVPIQLPLTPEFILVSVGLIVRFQYQKLAEPVSESPERTSIDKWFTGPPNPVIIPQNQYLYQTFAIDPIQLTKHERITVDKWFVEPTNPVLPVDPRYLDPSFSNNNLPIVASPVLVSEWFVNSPGPIQAPSLTYTYQSFASNIAPITFPMTLELVSVGMSALVRFQYQKLAEPVLPPAAAAQVLVSEWFVRAPDPLFPPPIQYLYQSFTIDAKQLTLKERVSVDKWFVVTANPLPIPMNQCEYPSFTIDAKQLTLHERITVDKWFVVTPDPLPIPKNQCEYPAFTIDPVQLTLHERITIDKWYAEPHNIVLPVDPKYLDPSFASNIFPIIATQMLVYELSVGIPSIVRFQYQANAEPVLPPAVAPQVLVSEWFTGQQYPLPIAAINTNLIQSLAYTPFSLPIAYELLSVGIPAMVRFQYQALAEPVLPPSAVVPPVLVSEWFVEPTLPIQPPNVVYEHFRNVVPILVFQSLVSEWFEVTPNPVIAIQNQYLYQSFTIDPVQLTQHERITMDKWFIEPQIPIPAPNLYYTYPPFANEFLVAPPVVIYSWYVEPANPIVAPNLFYTDPTLVQPILPISAPTPPTLVSEWFVEGLDPLQPARNQFTYQSLAQNPLPPLPNLDKWWNPASEPVRSTPDSRWTYPAFSGERLYAIPAPPIPTPTNATFTRQHPVPQKAPYRCDAPIAQYQCIVLDPAGHAITTSAATNTYVQAMALQGVGSNGVGEFLLWGEIFNLSWNFVPGQLIYLDNNGFATQTVPVGANAVIIGVGLTQTKILFDPMLFASASGSGTANRQIFLTSGSFTPPKGVTTIFVTMCGGGGGGGAGEPSFGAGGGGGAGTMIMAPFAVTPGSPVLVTVGSGGLGGSSLGANGADGGDSIVGSLVAKGGKGGKGATGAAAGNGGNAGNASIQGGISGSGGGAGGIGGTNAGAGGSSGNVAGGTAPGNAGSTALVDVYGAAGGVSTGGSGGGGGGGGSLYGAAGAGGTAPSQNGSNAALFGAGGGGGSGT